MDQRKRNRSNSPTNDNSKSEKTRRVSRFGSAAKIEEPTNISISASIKAQIEARANEIAKNLKNSSSVENEKQIAMATAQQNATYLHAQATNQVKV